ncbi:energy transducer TonB [Spirosoma taeanense]|uniref:Energy transducer TonB n=1 Tax=Spirosoma taeanense TaxID=2735870 RepID=A0A6M5Y8G4_9BACT|nr:energy transducer TonB [Spirosoma taeanense]QJW89473.1 energy transducer TonB [Spirosoma taeanense]
MLKFFLTFWLLGLLGVCAQAQQPHLDSKSTPSRPIYTVAEEHPAFPGGMNKLGNYLRKNLQYPQAARQARKEGKVFVTFIVGEQGAIEEVRALNSLDPELDAEAVRVVQAMPNWKPAKVAGKAVACRYNLPINFAL